MKNIGRYEVVEQLGKGGMSNVYLAHDPFVKRQVAVKVLPRKFTHDPQFRVRFQREAEVIAALEHGYIVPVYDFGDHENQPFIVMRYLPGGTLADRIKKGALSISELIPFFQRIGSALDYAHSKGIVHRDIKPGNILFDMQGEASLSDFGIAKIQEATAAFTGTGNLIGTPAYMSPEQAQGEKTVDGRADIYSLGVVLFEALTGELPYQSDTPMGVAIAHIQEPIPSLLSRKSDLPPDLDVVIRKAMDKEPANRFQSALEMVLALKNRQTSLDDAKGRDQGTVLATAPETIVEPPLSASATIPSKPRPAPAKGWVMPPETPRPVPAVTPKKSIWPRLLGIGGALLVLLVCIGLVGGIATGLIPNPLGAANPTAKMTEAPASSGNEITPNTQVVEENTTATTDPTLTPATASNILSPEITDDKGIEMILIPAGQFPIGGSDISAEPDEKPVHWVTLDEYYIDKFEVTNAAYIACVEDAGACKPPVQNDSFTRSKYYGVDEYLQYPVVYVDWNMANAYCAWRGARLPTEAEWEKAARGTEEMIYPWGSGIDCQKANYYGPNGCYGGTTPVGSYEDGKSPYGVYDMAGNVWEWVADWFSENYYETSLPTNPSGPDSGQSKVLRGGSWNRQEYDVRVANRNKYSPKYFNFDIGFRCASDVTQ